MFVKTNLTVFAGALLLAFSGISYGTTMPTELFLRGYSVVPTPRHVELDSEDFEFSSTWFLDPGKLGGEHIAARTLVKDLQEFYGLTLRGSSSGDPVVRLSVQSGAVQTPAGSDAGVAEQAYSLSLTPASIRITGNGEAGLFYGVQTLLQLLKVEPNGRLSLPVGKIEDWPSFQLRSLHWDTKHHQDRMETLKRYLDWSARFKVNMIGFELEDKFEYPSHPVIGAPGAFTTEQLQEIVDYGLERFIQVVPTIQSPAHLAYVLKHQEFAHLKADGNNYQACLCDEESYELIFSMYDDVIQATKGVDYFHVSTDELYYAGICEKCEAEYNPENRSLKWVEFAQRAHEFLAGKGRRMLAWVEWPLMAKHISMLPPDIIDGVLGRNQAFIEAQEKIGMRQLVYTSMQGGEFLIPNNWGALGGDFRSRQGRLWSTYRALAPDIGNPIGVFGAAWGDSGLHNETFWMGWSTVAQYGWTHRTPEVEQHVVEFVEEYYGPDTTGIVEIYQGLQKQARFFENSWDTVVSRVRDSGYGNSYGPGVGIIRRDETLPQPALPQQPGLEITPVYHSGRYGDLVEEARGLLQENQELTQKIFGAMHRVQRNRYNLEVFLSLAQLTRHHNQLIVAMHEMESNLMAAARAARSYNPNRDPQEARRAVEGLLSAFRLANSVVEDRKRTFAGLEEIWEKSRFPKGQSLNGREFVHILDDTKDHWADRRPDLSYMIAPEESINLEGWMEKIAQTLKDYAAKHDVDIDEIVLELEPEE
jgi:hypothetical protein